jgi:hypothetical protein
VSNVTGAAQGHAGDRYGSVRQMRGDVANGTVAAGCDGTIARAFQSTFQIVVFGRDVIDLDIGKMQGVDDGILVVAFDPDRGVVHQKRPHDPITALVSCGSPPRTQRYCAAPPYTATRAGFDRFTPATPNPRATIPSTARPRRRGMANRRVAARHSNRCHWWLSRAFCTSVAGAMGGTVESSVQANYEFRIILMLGGAVAA